MAMILDEKQCKSIAVANLQQQTILFDFNKEWLHIFANGKCNDIVHKAMTTLLPGARAGWSFSDTNKVDYLPNGPPWIPPMGTEIIVTNIDKIKELANAGLIFPGSELFKAQKHWSKSI